MRKRILFCVIFCLPFFIVAQEDAWVFLTDKPDAATAIANPISILSQKAIDRKAAFQIVIDERDVPIYEQYVLDIANSTGITIMTSSKWFNALHVRGTLVDIQALEGLESVSHIEYANKSIGNPLRLERQTQKTNKFEFENFLEDFDYGSANNQVTMIGLDELHLKGYTGEGITIAVLDAGFPNVDTMSSFERLRSNGNLKGSYNFVEGIEDVYADGVNSNHGTLVLSTMAGYIENSFVGTAPDASYYLFTTEDSDNENPVEESYWVRAAEVADSLGVDIINSSLGYTTFDDPKYDYANNDMDGTTTFISRGATIASEKGILVINSAGNSGNNSWQIVGAPADTENVFSIGAVNAFGNYATFSSLGSDIQPTQKPDVVARGATAAVINENDNIGSSNGTSFSSPIIAGATACLWQSLPNDTNIEIMNRIRMSASAYNSPNNFIGYGIPNFGDPNILSVLDFVTIDTGFVVFPNPTDGVVHFSYDNNLGDIIQVVITDTLGTTVYQTNDVFLNQVDLNTLEAGIYLLSIAFEKQTKTVKIFKK